SIIVLLFTFFIAVLNANAQSETKSDSWEDNYSEAQLALENAEYSKAFEKAIAAERLLKKWNPEVALVKIHALHNLTQSNDYVDSTLNNSLLFEVDRYIKFNRGRKRKSAGYFSA
ncbi:hypothetical protein, partial [Pontibacter sp. BAB1700]|uniref:hypothetical protein n=1 Tax=Pontibacter sp. BAB1700 TaxID=1144253 RepID=UPI00026BCE6B